MYTVNRKCQQSASEEAYFARVWVSRSHQKLSFVHIASAGETSYPADESTRRLRPAA